METVPSPRKHQRFGGYQRTGCISKAYWGHQLRENQRIIIQIVDLDLHNDSVPKPSTITEWKDILHAGSERMRKKQERPARGHSGQSPSESRRNSTNSN